MYNVYVGVVEDNTAPFNSFLDASLVTDHFSEGVLYIIDNKRGYVINNILKEIELNDEVHCVVKSPDYAVNLHLLEYPNTSFIVALNTFVCDKIEEYSILKKTDDNMRIGYILEDLNKLLERITSKFVKVTV